MPENSPKICPLLMVKTGSAGALLGSCECIMENCAFYDKNFNQCSIFSISAHLLQIRSSLQELASK